MTIQGNETPAHKGEKHIMKYKFFLGIAVLFGPLIASLIYTQHYVWAGVTWTIASFTIATALMEAKTPAKDKDLS